MSPASLTYTGRQGNEQPCRLQGGTWRHSKDQGIFMLALGPTPGPSSHLNGPTLGLLIAWLALLFFFVFVLNYLLQLFAQATQHQEGTMMCLQLSQAMSHLAVEGEGREGTAESYCCFTYQYILWPPQCAPRRLCCSCPTRHLDRLVFQDPFSDTLLHI